MRITILGTANAWGPNPLLKNAPAIPMEGKLSTGKGVEIREFRTSLLIESDDGKRILVDCSPDLGSQVRRFGIQRPDAILITHPHFDHVGGLDELNLYQVAHNRNCAEGECPPAFEPIDVYSTRPCWTTVRDRLGFGYIEDVLGIVCWHPLCLHPKKREFRVGSLSVTPFAVKHSDRVAPGAIGFRFEESENNGGLCQALYTGDLWAVADHQDPVFKKPLDVAIVECDRWQGDVGEREGGGHMSFTGVLAMLQNGGILSDPVPKQLVLVHFGDNGPVGSQSDYADWRREALQGLNGRSIQVKNADHVIGYEGLVLD